MFSCRLLTVNLTKNGTPTWMFFYFILQLENIVLVSKLIDLLLNVDSRIDFNEVDITVTSVLLHTFSSLIFFWITLVSNCLSWQLGGKSTHRSKHIITLHILSRLTK